MLDETIEMRDRVRIAGEEDAGSPATAQVYEFDPISDERWPTLVAGHPQASVFHTRAWLSALQSTYGYRPLVLTTCPPDVHVTGGMVCCEIRSWLTGRRLVSLPFSDHCEPLVNDRKELDAILAHARRAADKGRYDRIEIRPHSAPGKIQDRKSTRLNSSH